MLKRESISKIQLSDKQRKEILDVINSSKKKKISQLQITKQIKFFVQSILRKNKDQLLGGGSCCSKSQINESNFHSILIIDRTSNNFYQNIDFENEYNKQMSIEIVSQNIENHTQLKLQKCFLKKCILDQIIQSENLMNSYFTEIQQIFEVYMMLEVTITSNKSDIEQEEFQNILNELKQIQSFEQDYPIKELIYYIEILIKLNVANHKYDQTQINEIIKIKEFVCRVLKFNKNRDFSTLKQKANEIKQNIHIFDKIKEFVSLKYQIEIWIRKIEKFGDKFIMISEEEQIHFYSSIFFEINKKQNQQDYIMLTLIRINFILDKFQKENVQDDNKTQKYQQFSADLIKRSIELLLNELMQNSNQFTNQLFLIFSIENQNYRYITLSILLSINSIFTISSQNTQNQDYLIDFLCNKYLTEHELAIRVIFEKSHEFVNYFNENIKIESFKQKMIDFDKKRKEKLQQYVKSLKTHERSINSFDDIIKLISENALQKWERDIMKRQRLGTEQKDDVLLEVRDLYINQTITYLNGNTVFQKSKEKNSAQNEYLTNQLNALQDILKLFLSPDYSYRLKCINDPAGQIDDEGRNIFKNQSNQCQILGIIAEGGTGKSMLMKKIETFLIEKLMNISGETQSETGNYLPILVKCNSLHQKNPSLDEYLKQQGINEEMIQSLKHSERNKLILFDGYDEYSGDYFIIYSTLKIKQWKNTKLIITTRKEKLSENDARVYFSKLKDNGDIDEMSYTLVKLEEFTSKDIFEYADRYFKQKRKTNEINLIQQDLQNLKGCLTNVELEKLLHLPINLYLFTRMLVQLNDIEIKTLKSNISDQIGIQELFFSDQFEREAQSFIDSHVDSIDLKKDKKLRISIKNCYFEYFSTIAMLMFKNRGVVQANFLQLERSSINFNIPQQVIQILQQPSIANFLLDKIKNYINSKIITKVKSEESQKINQSIYKSKEFIEFKHKSLFEYFVAKGMKNDFDDYGEDIYKLNIKILEQFKINQKYIMVSGQNQSEQQILIKLYKVIKNQIESEEFSQNYYNNLIEKNNRYIQYLKRSQIQTNTDISKIDIGASNLISALFISKFSFYKLNLKLCSFSKAYISTHKSIEINFDRCNLKHAFLQNSQINLDSCNTEQASIDAFSKVFDTNDIYSFKKVLWGQNNILYSISENGIINTFTVTNQDVKLFKSKQLSHSPLIDFHFVNDNQILVQSNFTLFSINSNTFEIYSTHKFNQPIQNITLVEENILVLMQSSLLLTGTFQDGFQEFNQIGRVYGCAYNQIYKILVTFKEKTFFIWNKQKNFELVKKIQEHVDGIFSIAFSADGKYLATGSWDKTCKIWNVEKDFQLFNTIESDGYIIINFSADGKYFATGFEDKSCKIWNIEKDFELNYIIQGHTKDINSIAFTSDGKYLATSTIDNTCNIWNAEKDFEFINDIKGHTHYISTVAFSSDGKYLATGSWDNTCKIWNVEKDFRLICTIQEHTKYVSSIVFSPDGKYFVSGSWDETYRVFNATNDFQFITIQELDGMIDSVVFSIDGKYLATGSSSSFEGTLKIWDVEKNFELIFTNKIHNDRIKSVVFSADGKYLITGSKDLTCKIWNLEKGFEFIHKEIENTLEIQSVAFSADGKYLVTGDGTPYSGTFNIWNAKKDFSLIKSIEGHTNYITSVAFSTDGKYLATGSYDKTCKIWNTDKGFELINIIQGHNDIICSVDFSADGKYLATGSEDKACKIWNVEQGFEINYTIQGHTDSITSAIFSADGKYLATGSGDKTYKIWNTEKGFELINTIQGHTKEISSVAFSTDGKYLATGSEDATCKIWNAEKGYELINTIQGHINKINSVAFSADGKQVATCSLYNCKISNVEKGVELFNLKYENMYFINSVAFSTDGKYFVSGDESCQIWNSQKDFENIKTLDHKKSINSVAFSADCKYLATGSEDKTCRIWKVENCFELIKTIDVHNLQIKSVAFSADSKYLATGSEDSSCKIWNVEKDFELTYTIYAHIYGINSVTFSSDGKYLATSSNDRTCKIWNAQQIFQLNNLPNYEIINQDQDQKLKEKNSLKQIQSKSYQKTKVLDNIYIL